MVQEPTPASSQEVPSFFSNCGSVNNAAKTCQFGYEAASVTLIKQYSAATCSRGSTWNSSARSVTVSGGCSGQFEVRMKEERPQAIILTDIGQDPDDTQSLIRTLLYSNDVSIKAIIPTYRPGNRPVGTDIVRSVIAAYDKDVPNLIQHDIRFTRGEILLKRLKEGLNTNSRIGAGYDSSGSNHIISVVDSSELPTWVLVWGGSRELAQAIYKVRSTRSAAQFVKFQQKLRVYTIAWSQYSPEPGDYLAANAKDMFWIASTHYEDTKSATFRGMYIGGDTSMQRESWINANIRNRGNLGPLYPLNTTEDGMKEGDSPSLLHILPIGLSDSSLPKGGGWGGRYTKEAQYYATSKNIYTSRYVEDALGGTSDRRNSVARWRPAYQADFAARAKWLEASYGDSNHPPYAKLAGENLRTVRSGSTVTLDASPSYDPDGDSLSYRWWVYKEVSPNAPNLTISGNSSAVARITVPTVNTQHSVNVIVEVKDNGSPAMTRYQRVMLNLTP